MKLLKPKGISSKKLRDWTAISTLIALIGLIIALIFGTWNLTEAIKANKAQRLLSDHQMLSEAVKSAMYAYSNFYNIHQEDFYKYFLGVSDSVPDSFRTDLYYTLIEIEQVVWLSENYPFEEISLNNWNIAVLKKHVVRGFCFFQRYSTPFWKD